MSHLSVYMSHLFPHSCVYMSYLSVYMSHLSPSALCNASSLLYSFVYMSHLSHSSVYMSYLSPPRPVYILFAELSLSCLATLVAPGCVAKADEL